MLSLLEAIPIARQPTAKPAMPLAGVIMGEAAGHQSLTGLKRRHFIPPLVENIFLAFVVDVGSLFLTHLPCPLELCPEVCQEKTPFSFSPDPESPPATTLHPLTTEVRSRLHAPSRLFCPQPLNLRDSQIEIIVAEKDSAIRSLGHADYDSDFHSLAALEQAGNLPEML
jgi:hypothetical protein